jgi:uncharacterized protein involved in response to NO
MDANVRLHPIPLLRLGFRPFYLLGGLFAAVGLPVWMAVYFGLLSSPASMPAVFWHAHEMLFGFVGAVITGFLFTAVGNWTGRQTPTGLPLALLALLWLAGRIVFWIDAIPIAVSIIIDTAFLFLVTLAILRPVLATGNYRNLGVVAVVGLFAAANLLFHLANTGVVHYSLITALHNGLNAVILIIAVIGGRVIPFFTANAVPDSGARRDPAADMVAIGAIIVLLVVGALPEGRLVEPPVAIAAALANAWRMLSWGSMATLRRPILWVLHLGYAWIVAGLALQGLAGLGVTVPPQAAVHAITVGAIGSLTLGMMSRTALGHTGRPLTPSRPVVWAYVLVNLAALIRVAGAFVPYGGYSASLILAAAAWSAAWLVFFVIFWPILTRPRPDGRPG